MRMRVFYWLEKRFFPFHVAKLVIFTQTDYHVCFASFHFRKMVPFFAEKRLNQ